MDYIYIGLLLACGAFGIYWYIRHDRELRTSKKVPGGAL